MINVLLPFTDLAETSSDLLKSLKRSDWDKKTLLKNAKISELATKALQIYLGRSETLPSPLNMQKNVQPIHFDDLPRLIHRLESPINWDLSEDSHEELQTKYATCWLLQQYIRQAVNIAPSLEKKFYAPFLQTVMQGLLLHYRKVESKNGTVLKIEIVGEAGGVWAIEKNELGWQNVNTDFKSADVIVYLDQQIAWLLFTDALHLNEIGQYYQIIGDRIVGNHFLSMRISTSI